MTNDELKKIIEKHEKWLKDQDGGERANLRRANMCDANLTRTNFFRIRKSESL